jgi:multiple antibiotic resistance protein
MGVSVRAFQIAGGIVLFTIALDMIRHDDHPADHAGGDGMAVALYPIAIPKIAGPGAMLAVMLLIGDDRALSLEQLATVGVLALVMAITLIVLLLAMPLSRLIGHAGIGITERVMGFFLLALAVNTILTTLVEWLSLPRL